MPGSPRWHALAPETLWRELGSGPEGLSAAAAADRLRRHGPNTLPEMPRRGWWRILAAQCASPLIYLLLGAAALAYFIGEARDGVVILVVVVGNAVLGAYQEGRADRSMEALRRLAPRRCRVVRDGRDQEIEAAELVPGDVLRLAAGEAVGADARLIDAVVLAAAEAALTGESVPVAKQPAVLPPDTPLAERSNLVFAGTHLTSGRGRAVVVATGLGTEVGRIAQLTTLAQEAPTPLERRIARFGRQLLYVAAGLFLLVMAAGMVRGIPPATLVLVAVSQVVSLVPEGLPVALTIALAVGMQRMARRRAVVRRLAAVETLGCADVICTDKTGTLTRNEMTVTTVWLPDGRTLSVTGAGYDPAGELTPAGGTPNGAGPDPALRSLLEAAVLCNDAHLVPPDAADPRWRPLGDPTEAALLTLAWKGAVDPAALRHAWPRRAEIPFEPAARLMAVQHGHTSGAQRVLLKGAPERVLDLCRGVRTSGGEAVLAAAESMAAEALRVLAFAEVPDATLEEAAGFGQFRGRAVLLGLVAQMDPPREEVPEAIAACRTAGIRPVMVTGDHKATALAIARRLGLAREGDEAVDGRELEAMTEETLQSRLDRIAVYARVQPEQKLRLVEAFQAQGRVVAMTGDGVNDAPALVRADVGVAMGLTGTEVAKNAAEMVITDDNFTTLVRAVEEGRLVYANIQKLLLFLFATSIDEVLVLLGVLLAGGPLPLLAVQILWINIVTEGTLTVNLVMEGLEGDEMRRPPVRARAPLVTRDMVRRMAVMVPASVAVTLGFYLWRLGSGLPLDLVRTETFTLLAVCQWFNVINCESATRSALQLGLWRNKWLLAGLAVANLLQLVVVYWEPLGRLFHTAPVPLADVLLIGALGSVVLWAEEFRKWLARRRTQTGAMQSAAS